MKLSREELAVIYSLLGKENNDSLKETMNGNIILEESDRELKIHVFDLYQRLKKKYEKAVRKSE